MKGREKNVIRQIDQGLADKWDSLEPEEQTLWQMNCLLYTGAEVALKRGIQRKREGVAEIPTAKDNQPDDVQGGGNKDDDCLLEED